MDLIINNMPPIMFLTLIGFLLLGFPVAFSLAANGILYCLLGILLSFRLCQSVFLVLDKTTPCWQSRSLH